MTEKDRDIAKKIKQNILEIDKNAEVILYGSRATGKAGEKSDWDIIVLTKYPADYKIESKFTEHLYKLELETEEVFSLFVYSKNDRNNKQRITPFYENVNKEGILL